MNAKTLVGPHIEQAIEQIVARLSLEHRKPARDALQQSIDLGGLPIIIKHGDIQYHAQWVQRQHTRGTTIWLGSALVVLESSRAIAI